MGVWECSHTTSLYLSSCDLAVENDGFMVNQKAVQFPFRGQ